MLLLLLVRALPALALGDVYFTGEELAKGGTAVAILQAGDLGLPYPLLNFASHEGGGFVVAHLRALAFLLVGPNLVAVKLVALCTSALVLLSAWKLVRHAFGLGAARVFALLFVFCTRTFQRGSLLSLGTHFETVGFLALILHYGGRVAFERGSGHRDALFLGLASGFGLYFSYQCAPAVLAVLLVLLWKRRDLLRRGELLTAAGGAFAGALPLLLTWLSAGSRHLAVRGEEVFGGFIQNARRAAVDLYLPLVSNLDGLHWIGFLIASGAAVAGGVVLYRRRDREPRAWRFGVLLLLYAAAFLGVYFASGLTRGSFTESFILLRYSGLWLVGLCLASALLARGLGAARQLVRRGPAAAVAVLAGGGPPAAPAPPQRRSPAPCQQAETGGRASPAAPRTWYAGGREQEPLWTDRPRPAGQSQMS